MLSLSHGEITHVSDTALMVAASTIRSRRASRASVAGVLSVSPVNIVLVAACAL
jgi:hypothetical protein